MVLLKSPSNGAPSKAHSSLEELMATAFSISAAGRFLEAYPPKKQKSTVEIGEKANGRDMDDLKFRGKIKSMKEGGLTVGRRDSDVLSK